MSKNKSNNAKKYEKVNITSHSPNHEIRSFFIDTAIQTIDYMSNKVYNGRIRDEEKEKIKIQQLKLIINACNVGNRVLKDRQLDDYEEDMKALRDGLNFKLNNDDDVIELSPQAIQEIEDLDERLEKFKEENNAKV